MKIRRLLCPTCSAYKDAAHEIENRRHVVNGVEFWCDDSHYNCLTCGEELSDPDVPDFMVPIFDAYRKAAGLLSTEELKAVRESTGLSQVAFATLLGMSPATIVRYEQGSPHNDKEDVLFRLVALKGAVPMLLKSRGHLLQPGQLPKPKPRGGGGRS
jgi:putative zinc finger/helix-turn-helix YgiT family protein